MTFYVTSPNFHVLSVIINFLLAKNHRENILKRTISHTSNMYKPYTYLWANKQAQTHQTSRILESRSSQAQSISSVHQAMFLSCCQDCPSCPVNAVQMGHATRAIWAAVRKCYLNQAKHSQVSINSVQQAVFFSTAQIIQVAQPMLFKWAMQLGAIWAAIKK